jgi:hypothetical protein
MHLLIRLINLLTFKFVQSECAADLRRANHALLQWQRSNQPVYKNLLVIGMCGEVSNRSLMGSASFLIRERDNIPTSYVYTLILCSHA